MLRPLFLLHCLDRFAVLLVDEPLALFNDFLERFQSLCQLELQLPSLKPEDLKSMVSLYVISNPARDREPRKKSSWGKEP